MAFRIGQKVVVACDRRAPCGREAPFKKNDVLTISGINEWGNVELLEIGKHAPTGIVFWFRERFRPAVERKTDISAFKEILDRENHGLPSRVDYPADCEPK